MPWKVFKEGGKYCLHKMNGSEKGDTVHCHDTAEEARRQQAALYASEKKEITPEEAIIYDENGEVLKEFYEQSMPAYASNAHSFEELDADREARERVSELGNLMSDFQALVGNIVYTPPEAVDSDTLHELDSLYEEFKTRASGLLSEPLDDSEEDKEVWTTAYVNNLPDSSFLYVEPGGKKDSEGKTEPRTLRHLPVKDATGKPDAAHIRNAAARANQVKLRNGSTVSPALAKRLIARAQGMLKKIKKETFIDKAVKAVKNVISPPEPDNNLMIWKEENGEYGWITSYSNKFIDRDNPPDVIASTAHKEFVNKVDQGLAPLPDLYLWHVPEWKIGYATALAYDDNGFPIAIGKFDDNAESKEIAEWLSKQTDFGVSHGMYNRTIQRDAEDPSVIIAYESHEISPLPKDHAANLLADWNVYEIKELEEVDMTIPAEKRQELLNRGVPDETLTALEERNKQKAETASAEGVKSKEAEEVQPVPETPETPATPVEEGAEAPDFPTRQEVAEAVATVVAPVVDELKQKQAEIDQKLIELAEMMKEFKDSDEKRIKEIIAMTPRDSLATLMATRLTERASSSKQTKVGENDNLLNKKPREEEVKKEARVGISFIDNFLQDGK